MSKLLLFFILVGFYKISLIQGNMLGTGIWSLISISKCPDENDMDEIILDVDAEKHKLNRTIDGINAKLTVKKVLNEDYAVLIKICKYVDGGCKDYQVLSDDSAPAFGRKYAKKNMKEAFTLAKIDPPDFPVDAGEYDIEDFVINYCEMPRKAPYGKFEALAYLLSNKKKVGCVKCVLEFNEFKDKNYCDD